VFFFRFFYVVRGERDVKKQNYIKKKVDGVTARAGHEWNDEWNTRQHLPWE